MRVLVVDDEAPARARIRGLLEALPGWECCGEAATGEQALMELGQTAPDVVLLDIRMPGMDGLETARHMASLDQPPAVIFTTAFEEHALEAFEAQAVGYLLKPVRAERLDEALGKVARLLYGGHERSAGEEQEGWFAVTTPHGIRRIAIEEILCLHADHKYVSVLHDGGEVLTEYPLKRFEHDYPDRFLRVHRSTLVAKGRILAVERCDDGHYHLLLRGSDYRPEVSRRLLAEVRGFLRGE